VDGVIPTGGEIKHKEWRRYPPSGGIRMMA